MKIVPENMLNQVKVESILQKISYLYGAQDDYLDIYGDYGLTGKYGTDIGNGKLSWVIVEALKQCDENKISCLKENYGKKNEYSEKLVKNIFNEINIHQIYRTFVRKMLNEFDDHFLHLDGNFEYIIKPIITMILDRKK